MAGMKQKRDEAKKAGVPVSEIRSAESVEELDALISAASRGKGGGGKVAKKKAAVKKNSATRKSATKATAAKKSGRKSVPAAKSTKGKAKRATAASDDLKRNLLSGVNFKDAEGWNPRKGSAPDRIITALRKARGNRSTAFDMLVSDVWDFVGKKKRNGSKRTKQEAHDMLRYRISRTAWDFALKTGQHETAKGRVEYGTGGTGAGTFKRSNGNSKKSGKASTKKATAKPAAKKGAAKRTNKAAAKKAGAKAAAKKRR